MLLWGVASLQVVFLHTFFPSFGKCITLSNRQLDGRRSCFITVGTDTITLQFDSSHSISVMCKRKL